jgi:hypothetical protein
MTEQQNKQIFATSIEEDNPFSPTREDEGSFSRLIEDYVSSEQFWAENIQHKYAKAEI